MVDFFHSLVPLCAAPLERQYRRSETCVFVPNVMARLLWFPVELGLFRL